VEDLTPPPEGQSVGLKDLRDFARQAVRSSGKTQNRVATELEVTDSAISQAVNEPARNLVGLQRRIIDHLTPYTVREEHAVTYTIERKK